MSTSVTIRAATPGDLADIATLISLLNHEEGYRVSASPEALAATLFTEDAPVRMRALVAEQGGEVCAVALYYWGYDTVSAANGYHLADIVVDGPWRGRGIGGRIFSALAAQCLHEGGQWVSLTALRKNSRARRFYERLGMVRVAVDFYAIGPEGLQRCAAMS